MREPEFFSSTLLPPFLQVLQGAHDGVLAKHSLELTASYFFFQPKHCGWFDKLITKEFANFMQAQYPLDKVGIILERSSIHTYPEIVDNTENLGLVIEFIHVGMWDEWS